MPLHGTAKPHGRGLNRCAPVTRIQDQRRHVAVGSDRAVHLCLDVVVKLVLTIGNVWAVSRNWAEPNRGDPPAGLRRKFNAP